MEQHLEWERSSFKIMHYTPCWAPRTTVNNFSQFCQHRCLWGHTEHPERHSECWEAASNLLEPQVVATAQHQYTLPAVGSRLRRQTALTRMARETKKREKIRLSKFLLRLIWECSNIKSSMCFKFWRMKAIKWKKVWFSISGIASFLQIQWSNLGPQFLLNIY